MKYPMLAFLIAALAFAPAVLAAEVKSETLIATTRSWDGRLYKPYSTKQPELTVIRITIPAHTRLAWHEHPEPNAAYILAGDLIIEKHNGQRHVVHAGEAVAETMDTIHRGITGAKPVVLLAFYAGAKGQPVTVPWP